MRFFDGEKGWFEQVTFSPGGRRVAAFDDRWSHLWVFDTAGGPPGHWSDARGSLLCFYPDDDRLLLSNSYHTMLADCDTHTTTELESLAKLIQFIPLPDGRLLTLHQGAPGFGDYRYRAKYWHAGADRLPALESEVHLGGASHTAWFAWPDGSMVGRIDPPASYSAEFREGQLLTLPELRSVASLKIPNKWYGPVVVSPAGDQFVWTDGRRLFRCGPAWDAAPGKVLNTTVKHFTGIAFHPSGQYLAATSNDTTVKLYDTATWQLAKTFTWDVGRLRSVAFSPDGALAAVGSDTGKVVVWDVDL